VFPEAISEISFRRSGGTVEYYSTGNSSPCRMISASGSPCSYNHLVLSAKAGDTIRFPGKSLEIIGNLIIGRSSAFSRQVILSQHIAGHYFGKRKYGDQKRGMVFPNSTARQITLSPGAC
jgi:hypothetical protein